MRCLKCVRRQQSGIAARLRHDPDIGVVKPTARASRRGKHFERFASTYFGPWPAPPPPYALSTLATALRPLAHLRDLPFTTCFTPQKSRAVAIAVAAAWTYFKTRRSVPERREVSDSASKAVRCWAFTLTEPTTRLSEPASVVADAHRGNCQR